MKKLRISCRGLIEHNGRVLLQNIDNRNFWNVPGGGYDSADRSVTDCVVREILEETGMQVDVVKLFYVQEFQTEQVEQIELFYLLKASDITQYSEYFDDVDAPNVSNRLSWFSFKELKNITLKPLHLQKTFKI